VTCSPAFRWTVGLLIPLTLAWKISVGADNPDEFTNRIVPFITHRGFAVTTEEAMGVSAMQLIRAENGECRMIFVDRLGTGWTRELMGSNAEATDRNFIVFRGQIYEGNPTWLMAIAVVYFRTLRRLGLGRSALVVGVAASPACDPERLAWNEL
jgi:hypothetical protein